jgi:hypothetical protein
MKKRYGLPFIAAFVLCVMPLGAADLPDGPGKALIERECGSCHETSHVQGRRTRDEWIDTVSKMMERGASLNSTEFDTVIDYLAKNFAKEDKNIGTSAAAKK